LAAAFAALVFAVHPLRVEPVAWASARGDVLAGFFVLLAILAYVKAAAESAGPRYGRWIAAAAVFYALALLGKGAALTLPLGLIILDVYPLRRFGSRRVWVEKLPFFALALVAGLVAVYGKYYGGLIYGLTDYTPAQRLALSAYGLIFYLWKTIWPSGLAPLYQLPHAVGFSEPAFLFSALAAAALTILLFALRRRWPWALAAWAWHGVMLLPTLGLLQNGPQIAADRYDYLAAPAAALLAGAAALYLSRRSHAIFGPAATVAALLAVFTWAQAALWRDPVALWSRAVAYNREAHLAHQYLGTALLAAGNVEQALDEFDISKRIKPDYASAYLSIAFVLGQLGKTDGAIENYRIGVRLFPGSAAGHYNLANQLFKRGDKDAAIEEYRAALRLDPRNASAHNNLGFLLAAKGEVDEPLAHFTAALQLNPRHVTAYYNMGMLMLRTGQPDRAADFFSEALRLSPGAPDLQRALEVAQARRTTTAGDKN
ncbi:MAG TPA: tetratricopeptide repeat protein, partial [Verrucomicrobiae bacterium]|nr:tetratricopeptide repeat protein [Verrucomicrobiae bacterium]